MTQAVPPRETSTVKKINERPLLISLNKITHYIKKWTTACGVLKKICSQKLRYHERTLRLEVLRKSSSLEKVTVPKFTLANTNVYNCSSKIFTILNE